MDAILCELHYSVHYHIEVAWIGRTDGLPYDLEGRAHVCGELGNDLSCAHCLAPTWRALEASFTKAA
jgi:hypothetical protein